MAVDLFTCIGWSLLGSCTFFVLLKRSPGKVTGKHLSPRFSRAMDRPRRWDSRVQMMPHPSRWMVKPWNPKGPGRREMATLPGGGKWEVDSGRLPEGFKRSLP